MNNTVHDLRKYRFARGEQIMIDTNIWLYMFPPPKKPGSSFAYKYSKGFKKLLQAKAQPVTDQMILSEYLNSYCRIEHSANHGSMKYKAFRKTKSFQDIARAACSHASQIINLSKIHSTAANDINYTKALEIFASRQMDFNDAIIADVCHHENMKLMTNDGDFMTSGIEILTLNNRLL